MFDIVACNRKRHRAWEDHVLAQKLEQQDNDDGHSDVDQ